MDSASAAIPGRDAAPAGQAHAAAMRGSPDAPAVNAPAPSSSSSSSSAAAHPGPAAAARPLTVAEAAAAHMREQLRIGVPYRADGNGRAHAADLDLVTRGTGIQAVSMVSKALLEATGSEPANPPVMLAGVHGVFLPGGPHHNPHMVDQAGKGVDPNYRNRKAEGEARHAHEEGVIDRSRARNLPLLAVCGGSWRLCAASGGTVRQLGRDDRELHAGPMGQVHDHRHDVQVPPGSLLHHVLSTDGPVPGHHPPAVQEEEEDGAAAAMPAVPASVRLPVNSVHWAVNEFTAGGPIRTTARSTDRAAHPEAFEDPRSHYLMGVQWHPEYAQERLDAGIAGADAAAREQGARMNQRLMASLGQAAVEGEAARIMQRAGRGYLFRRRLQRESAQSQAGAPVPEGPASQP